VERVRCHMGRHLDNRRSLTVRSHLIACRRYAGFQRAAESGELLLPELGNKVVIKTNLNELLAGVLVFNWKRFKRSCNPVLASRLFASV
jgi:hypothetical protein